ncbi:MAG: DUF4917 family protein [Flavobacteriales bacterium]|nr:DUF4917 family protein [Flavobacteriales bacterium]
MKFEELQSYQSVLQSLKQKNRQKHLLIGNGFSMAYDAKIFSYNALYKFIDELDNEMLSKLFEVINTKNFELVMQQLDNFIEIAEAFEVDKKFTEKLKKANEILRNSLIDAISKLHPEHVFEVSFEKSQSCANFLTEYLDNNGFVFSTNYDLLMYWVLLRNELKNAGDGFGRELTNPEELKKGNNAEWSDLQWGKNKDEQKVFYLHGTLSIFDTGIEIEKEVYTSNNYLLQNIKHRLDAKDYPIFVTAGNGNEKLEHITHNRYLTFCYEQLSKIEGSLISFGFNFGEYDEHIISAINKAAKDGLMPADGKKLYSIYIGIYSKENLEHIKKIEHKFRCKVCVYNASTANIWGD